MIIVRSPDGVRAFHNICRHRGNKLVWQDYPGEETSGTCRQFTCKYHGWRYGLEGELNFVQQEGEFFDLDKADYGLAPVRVDTWEGFIFVNLDNTDSTPLRDYLGELGRGLEGYPFGEMTQVFKYRAEVGSNWKLFIDAFTEFYHAPVLHARQAVAEEVAEAPGLRLRSARVRDRRSARDGVVVGRDVAAEGPRHGQADRARAAQRALRSVGGADRVRAAARGQPRAAKQWGTDSFLFFPNFMILVWKPNWYLTYHYWPTAYNKHIFEGTLYFVPPRTARERLAQELAAVTFKEYALQDGNTLEATQTMLESRAVTQFPLGDQEILLRQLHHMTHEWVDDYEKAK